MRKGSEAEKTVREIRRRTRRRFSSQKEIRIVIASLRGEESVAALCRRENDKLKELLAESMLEVNALKKKESSAGIAR